MAITLADVQVTTDNDIDYNLIDETRRSSYLLERLVFDDTVTPGTNGGTLTAGYVRLEERRAADTRRENTEYPAREAKKKRYTVDLVPMGARYNIDRVYANMGDATTNEVIFQQAEARAATVAKFSDLFINGVAADFTEEVPEFDGLDAIVTGGPTESFSTGTTPWDWSAVTTQAAATEADLALRAWLRTFMRKPDVLFVNDEIVGVLERIASYRGIQAAITNEFGDEIPTFAGIPYVDLGEKDGSADPIVGTTGGVTSIYGAVLGLDAVHGYAMSNGQVMKNWLPDFSTAGAVKPGEVELGPVAIAAKRTRAAGAFRVKVA